MASLKTALFAAAVLAAGSPTLATAQGYYGPPDAVRAFPQNNTGGRGSVVISRGATGADTITNNSAAGGNANLPERAIPNGSAGGGSSGAR